MEEEVAQYSRYASLIFVVSIDSRRRLCGFAIIEGRLGQAGRSQEVDMPLERSRATPRRHRTPIVRSDFLDVGMLVV